jgi:hypothetical protein
MSSTLTTTERIVLLQISFSSTDNTGNGLIVSHRLSFKRYVQRERDATPGRLQTAREAAGKTTLPGCHVVNLTETLN